MLSLNNQVIENPKLADISFTIDRLAQIDIEKAKKEKVFICRINSPLKYNGGEKMKVVGDEYISLEWIMPDAWKGKVFGLAYKGIEERIVCLLAAGFRLASKLMATEKITINLPITIIAIKNNSFALELYEHEYGTFLLLATYPVNKWLGQNYSDLQILTCIIEELCHCFWQIADEKVVCYKVLEIMQQDYPELKIGDLYKI